MLNKERVRLADMAQLAPFSIMLLRRLELLLKAFNERYGWVRARQAVQGEPLAHVVERFWQEGTPVVELARDV